jgi:hypothetical protein
MKTLVFVLVPDDVPADDISEHCRRLLHPHRIDEDDPDHHGRFDYLVGAPDDCFNDTATESRLPAPLRQEYAGNICEVSRLPKDAACGALVTPDGQWHDLSDFGWRMVREPGEENRAAIAAWQRHYRSLVEAHPNCWVIAIGAHS